MKLKKYPPQLGFWCPGCECLHVVPYSTLNDGNWQLTGTEEQPTISPSLRILTSSDGPSACHVIVSGGMLCYCADCKHQYAGKTIPMQEIPDNF